MNKNFIYEYWEHTELGRKMIESESVSESDLLFLIPNNYKRMHGLPLTRNPKRQRSKKAKSLRKERILSFKLWDLISEIIEETLCNHWENNNFFDKFVDVKNVGFGDKDCFVDDIT